MTSVFGSGTPRRSGRDHVTLCLRVQRLDIIGCTRDCFCGDTTTVVAGPYRGGPCSVSGQYVAC